MPAITILPGIGTAPVNFAVTILPGGAAAPVHVPAGSAGAPLLPMTEASAQAFAAAVAAFVATLSPRAASPQQGPLFFGFFG